MFLFYVILYTVIFYCNTALVGAAMIRLRGGDPTLPDGFRIASQHFKAIVGYAIIAATVGMLLHWLRRQKVIGRIVAGIFGFAWNLATYFVVPILVTENVGPIEAVKRSAALLRKTWGEQVIGNFSIGAITSLVFFGLILIGIPAVMFAVATQSLVLIGAVISIFALALVAVGLISSALSGIYTAAVYQYATTGTAAAYFDQSLIQGAFRAR